MEAFYSKRCRQDFPTHIRNEFCADLAYFFVVIFMGLESVQVRLWDDRLCNGSRCPQETVPSLNGTDARHDGHCNAGSADGMGPIDEHVGIVKHLGEDEISARIDFLL